MRLVALLALVACTDAPDAGPPPGDTDADTDTGAVEETADTGSPCTNAVTDVSPADGAVDVALATTVVFTLAEADETATITVTDPAGTEVDGALGVDGTLVTWTTDALLPDTRYDAVLTHDCGTASVSFTTRAGVDVEGRVYEVALSEGVWVDPPNVGAILGAFLEDTTWLLSPTSVQPTTVDFLTAVGAAGAADPCVATTVYAGAAWSDPSFELAAPLLRLEAGGFPVDFQDARLSGTFLADGSRFGRGLLLARMDTRPLVPLISPDAEPDAFCVLAATLGVSCVACPDGTGPFCLDTRIEDLVGPEVAGPLVVRTEAEILADPACAP